MLQTRTSGSRKDWYSVGAITSTIPTKSAAGRRRCPKMFRQRCSGCSPIATLSRASCSGTSSSSLCDLSAFIPSRAAKVAPAAYCAPASPRRTGSRNIWTISELDIHRLACMAKEGGNFMLYPVPEIIIGHDPGSSFWFRLAKCHNKSYIQWDNGALTG